MIYVYEVSYINDIVFDWMEFYYNIIYGYLLDVNKIRKICFIKDLCVVEISFWLFFGLVYLDKLMYD